MGVVAADGAGELRERRAPYAKDTLAYYDDNAERFVADTAKVEFGALQGEFVRRVPEGGRVLDLGCGSGRDSLAFLHAGLDVVAVDGSVAMCEAAGELTGLSVVHALFGEFDPAAWADDTAEFGDEPGAGAGANGGAEACADGEAVAAFDGIWACSSLLHLPLDELHVILPRYTRALHEGGVFYMSFKLGNFQGMRNGRWFTDLDETAFRALVDDVPGLEVSSIDITSDVRPGRSDEKWLNAWCVRTS